MSRCFPYPPPRLLRNGVGGEVVAVSESIKLQRDWGKTVTEHDKKKRKEKKERKKNWKETKEVSYTEGKCNHPDKRLDRKGKEEEAERSGLTEEHDQPVCSQSLSYSSESTRSKRKRDDAKCNGTKSRNLKLCIRLPLQRRSQAHASINAEQLCSTSQKSDSLLQQERIIQKPVEEQYGAIRSKNFKKDLKGHQERITQKPVKEQYVAIHSNNFKKDLKGHQERITQKPVKEQYGAIHSNNCKKDLKGHQERITQKPVKEQYGAFHSGNCKKDLKGHQERINQMPVKEHYGGAVHSSNCKKDLEGHGNTAEHFVKTAPGISSHRKKLRKEESQYKSLIEGWVPPAFEVEHTNCGDEDWLFETKKEEIHACKRSKSDLDERCLGSSNLWPSAFYLPEVDIYALPYTVPF